MGELYRLMAVLMDQPWLAAVPGAVLLGLWSASRRRVVLAAALAWLAYLPYEYGMQRRILCSGECNIRVDLLLLYPVLLGLSILGVVSAVLALRRPRD
jgi:hypothetical protein